MVGKMALQCGHAKSGVSGWQPSSLAAKGQINRQLHGGQRKTDIMADLGESLPEEHRTIGFHQGTAEADRIQGGQNARMAGSGGGMALRGGHCSTMPVLGEWRNGRNAGRCRRESRLMRRESAAGVQPFPR